MALVIPRMALANNDQALNYVQKSLVGASA
jgi:hypothetical protein